jgi:hypothetical protein
MKIKRFATFTASKGVRGFVLIGGHTRGEGEVKGPERFVPAAVVLAVLTGTLTACQGHPPAAVSSRPPSVSPSVTPTASSVPAVSATPPACSGVNVPPGTGTLTARLISRKPAGTTFCLAAGTYNINHAVLLSSNDQLRGAGIGTTIIDESAVTGRTQDSNTYCLYGYGGTTGQHDVTVSDLTVQGCHNSTYNGYNLKEGDNWTVRRVESRFGDEGLTGNCDHCLIHDNIHYGVAPNAGIITNSELYGNGYCSGLCGGTGDWGMTKSVHLASMVWRNDYIHNNFTGIWCDGCFKGSTVLIGRNRIEDNFGPGVDFENSWGQCGDCSGGLIIVRNNTLSGNATDDGVNTSCSHDGQITIRASIGVVVGPGNTIDSSNGANALCVKDDPGSGAGNPNSPQATVPFTFTGNTVILRGTALVGETGDYGAIHGVSTDSSTFVSANNVYQSDTPDGGHFQFYTLSHYPPYWTYSQWQGRGFDASGSGSSMQTG